MIKSWGSMVEYGILCALEKYSGNNGLLTSLNRDNEYWQGKNKNNVYIFPYFTISHLA